MKKKSAFVVVPDYQLSLAIGKKGQNARLAAKLTGYKIDIKSESQAEEMGYFSEENDDYEEPEQEEAFDNIDDIVDGSYEESLEQQDAEEVKKKTKNKNEVLTGYHADWNGDKYISIGSDVMAKKIPLRQCLLVVIR